MKLLAIGILFGVAFFVAVGLLVIVGAGRSSPEPPMPPVPPLAENVVAPALALGRAYAAVAAHVKPAVVAIYSERMVSAQGEGLPFPFGNQFFRRFYGQGAPPGSPRKIPERSLGSGMILDKEGHILTNYHVVKDETKIKVILADKRIFKAKVVSFDPDTDVAVIIIEGPVPADLPTVQLGDSGTLAAGDVVMAIGAPFGFVQTVTTGIISATGRANVGLADYEDFLQTDAPINPGNSGGPLVNMHGQVIGMNTAIATEVGQFSGVGFAIPIDVVKTILPTLLKGEKVTRGYLGVVVQNLNSELAEQFKTPSTQGALVTQVTPDSPAAKAGIKVGDVIVAYDGKPVDNTLQLRNLVAGTPPNHKAKLTLWRDGKKLELAVTVGKLMPQKAALAQTGGELLSKFGLTVEPLTPQTAKQYGYENEQGLLITQVTEGTPAAMANLQAGELITQVDRQDVANLAQLREVLAKSATPNKVLLLIKHQGASVFVVLQVQ